MMRARDHRVQYSKRSENLLTPDGLAQMYGVIQIERSIRITSHSLQLSVRLCWRHMKAYTH